MLAIFFGLVLFFVSLIICVAIFGAASRFCVKIFIALAVCLAIAFFIVTITDSRTGGDTKQFPVAASQISRDNSDGSVSVDLK
jgi:hypothetical protein